MNVLTIPEVAALLRISVDHCYRLAKAGKIPLVKVGGTYRTTAARIAQYLAGEWTPPAPKPRRGRKLKDYGAQSFEDLTGQVMH